MVSDGVVVVVKAETGAQASELMTMAMTSSDALGSWTRRQRQGQGARRDDVPRSAIAGPTINTIYLHLPQISPTPATPLDIDIRLALHISSHWSTRPVWSLPMRTAR